MTSEISLDAARLDALEAERLQIQREINAYPPPIPGCDAYFNHLLERRAAVCEALSRLRAACGDAIA